MFKLKAFVAASFIILIASCSFPDATGAQQMMKKYWQFCMNDQYDSLKHFYMEDQVSEPQLDQIITSIHDLRDKYGIIKRVNNHQIGVTQSLGGDEKVELSYQVVYEMKILEHKFTFKKQRGEEFRITDHSWIIENSLE